MMSIILIIYLINQHEQVAINYSAIWRDQFNINISRLISGNIKLNIMETTLERQNILPPPLPYNDFDVDDQQGEELFNQIQIQSPPLLINEQSPSQQPEQLPQTPKKTKSFKIMKKNMSLDSDQIQDEDIQEPHKSSAQKIKAPKMDKKKKKELKKLKKKLKKERMREKQKQKNGSGLKRLRKEGQEDEKSQNQWSGQSSDQFGEDSDVSSDSMLNNLNPRKKNDSIKKTERKQGFQLKQLGNNPEVEHNNEQLPSDDSEYKQRHGKSKRLKIEKKEVTKNHQILKSLLEIGLCVDEQNQQNKKEGFQYDNGLEQIQNMKGAKKKGPKIKNKLFLDVDIDDNEENNEPLPKQIELEVKPRTNLGCSKITNSFLNKAERLKKVRGMQSEIKNEQFDKMMSHKAKQSMVKLISQKQIEDADEIQLDVKVPEVIRGREQLNNTMFLKRISSTIAANKIEPATALPAKKQLNRNEHKAVISRFDFFKSVAEDVKARRSRQITEQLIRNSFKVTKLQEIEQMRKKNQQKRKKEALMGSDREDEDQESSQQKNNGEKEDVIHQNKLKFMNFKIEVNRQNYEQNGQKNEKQNQKQAQKIQPEVIENTQKQIVEQKKVIPEKLADKQYKKLIRMEEEGVQNYDERQAESSSQMKSNEQEDEVMKQLEMKSENQNQIPEQSDQNQNEMNQDLLNESEPVDIEVDLEVSNLEENDQQGSEHSEQSMQVEEAQIKKPERNQEHEEYLSFLEAEGIQLKKNNKREKYEQKKMNEQKENDHLIENNDYFESDARRQFRKLRKLATIIKTKRRTEKKIKIAGQFFDEEAEEGSDNEDHDHEVKNINYDEQQKEYEGLDLDADLQELIDNAVDIDEQNEELAFRKYMEDVKIQDREELKRIMKGDFKRNRENDHIIDEMEEDEKKRIQRMEQIQQYLKQKQQEDGKGLYIENENKPEMNESDNESNEGDKNEKKQSTNVQQEIQVVDEMNEQNLKRYLDDKVVQTFRTTTVVRRPIFELPESYKRSKNTEMRNTMKPKESAPQNFKLKKTTSHLNEMIMKNKQKLKPLPLLKGFSLPVRK